MGSRHAAKRTPSSIKLEREDFIITSDDPEKNVNLPDDGLFDPDGEPASGHEIPLPNIFSSPFKNAPPPPTADSFASPSKIPSQPDEYPLPGTNSPVKNEPHPLLAAHPGQAKAAPASPPISIAMPTLTPSPGKKKAQSLRVKAHLQSHGGSGATAEPAGNKLRCVCDFTHNDGFLVQCSKCRLWQHIDCFYPNASSRPVAHRCHVCVPRFVNVDSAKRIQTKKIAARSRLNPAVKDRDDADVATTSISLHMPPVHPSPAVSLRTNTQASVVSHLLGTSHCSSASSHQIITCQASPILSREFDPGLSASITRLLSVTQPSSMSNHIGFHVPSATNGADLMCGVQMNNARPSKRKQCLQMRSTPDPQVMETEEEIKQALMERVASRARRYKHADRNRYTEELYRILFRLNKTGVRIKHTLIAEVTKRECETFITEQQTIALNSPAVYSLYDTVLEYRGELMTREEYLENHDPTKEFNPFVLFYSGVPNLTIVADASKYGNEARFMRRSCKPNCEVKHTFGENSRLHLVVWATQKIAVGKEVTIPFDFDYTQCNYEVFCPCGKKTCDVRRSNIQLLMGARRESEVSSKKMKLSMKSEKKKEKRVKAEPSSKSKKEKVTLKPEADDDFDSNSAPTTPSVSRVLSTNDGSSADSSLAGSPLKVLPLGVSRLRSDAEARASLTARLQERLSPSKGSPQKGGRLASTGSPRRGGPPSLPRSPLKPASPVSAYHSPAGATVGARKRSRKQQLVVIRNPFSEERNASSDEEDQSVSFWKR